MPITMGARDVWDSGVGEADRTQEAGDKGD